MSNPFVTLILQILAILNEIAHLYGYVIMAAVIVSWLIAFSIINSYNPTVRSILRGLDAITEPFLRQIRRIVPSVGGLDLSPMVALIILWWLVPVVLNFIGNLLVYY